LNRILLTGLLLLVVAATASAQELPKYEIFGGYATDLTGAGVAGEEQLPTHGVQAEFDRVVTSYFRVTGEFNAQFADHVVNIGAPPPPGGRFINGKELLGLFGPEATYRGLKRFDFYGHYVIGTAYGRQPQVPAIPVAHYLTWAYGIGAGVEWKLGRRVSARLVGIDWITTHFPINSPEAQDNWRFSSGFIFHLF
jgi:hypothetical protein